MVALVTAGKDIKDRVGILSCMGRGQKHKNQINKLFLDMSSYKGLQCAKKTLDTNFCLLQMKFAR
jgi:hypothetical protein